jgi:cytochrome c peroxidase
MFARLAVIALHFFLGACSPVPTPPPEPIGEKLQLAVPLGLPALDQAPAKAAVALGEKLFSSPLLSLDGSRSCASCHSPVNAFAEDQPVSIGVARKKGRRNAPTVLNAVYNRFQFHDGRAVSLEAQASGPILNETEMAHDEKALLAKLAADSQFPTLFREAFGEGPITLPKIAAALAAFERTLLSGNSAFDRFFYGGYKSALSESAQRGLAVFRDPQRGNCAVCHTIGEKHALFTDQEFHNLGAGLSPQGELLDLGRYEVTKREGDQGKFRTPTLRNIALTAPYMHDGSLKNLREVIDFYIAGGNANPYLDPKMKPLRLTRQEREDLIAFLESLNGGARP